MWEGLNMKEVYGTIRKLGATSKYKGYYFVAEAIRMTMEFQERPMKITKDIIQGWQRNLNPNHPI